MKDRIIQPRCDNCGRFIAFKDLDHETGTAIYEEVTPESEYTHEVWRTLCPKHAQEYRLWKQELSGRVPKTAVWKVSTSEESTTGIRPRMVIDYEMEGNHFPKEYSI